MDNFKLSVKHADEFGFNSNRVSNVQSVSTPLMSLCQSHVVTRSLENTAANNTAAKDKNTYTCIYVCVHK